MVAPTLAEENLQGPWTPYGTVRERDATDYEKRTVADLVRVGGLSINTVVPDDVLEGVGHEATIAALVTLLE
jgi:hypothetical protein